MKHPGKIDCSNEDCQALPRENLFAICLILFVILIFFAPYTRNLQQTDTYAKWFYSISAYRRQYKVNVRLAEWVYMEFFYRLMGEPQHYRAFHVSIGLGLDVIIVFLLWKIICSACRLRQSLLRLFALLPALMMRANAFYSDIFQFGVDTAPMFLGDLIAIISALAVTGTIIKKSVLLGTVSLAVSLLFRQTCLFWYIITGLFIVFCANTDSRYPRFFKSILPLVFTACIAVLPVLFLINFWAPAGNRGSISYIDLAQSRQSFTTTFSRLVRNCDGIQPNWFYTALLGVALGLNLPIWICCYRRKGASALFSLLAQECTVTLGVLAGIFFTVVFDKYLPHRITCGFASLLPLWLLFALRRREDGYASRKAVLPILSACLLLVNLSVNLHFTQVIFRGMVETNRIDQENARYYYHLILDHEKETGTEIRKLAWHNDQEYTWTLPGILGAGNINNRAFSFPWSQREIFPFTVGRRFQIVSFDEEIYQQYFDRKDWDSLSEDQLLFLDDTVYIVLY